MKLGIIGGGVVGNATAQAFKDHEVLIYDSNPLRATATLMDALDSELIFVCLPTPQKHGSLECDTSILGVFWKYLGADTSRRNFVLRSTVPIGYTKQASSDYDLPNLVHWPEFLTARTAVEDACNPTRLLIGDPTFKRGHCSWDGTACFTKLLGTCRIRWPHLPIHGMTSDESEFVKLMQNSFSAVKIAFFNEMRCLADKKGMDWSYCMEALLAGGWINPTHTQVPGPDGKRGFGGTCLPKDLANMESTLVKEGLQSYMTWAARLRNKLDRKE